MSSKCAWRKLRKKELIRRKKIDLIDGVKETIQPRDCR